MAVIQPTTTRAANKVTYLWETVTNADTCSPLALQMAMLAQVQVAGTFDSASVAMQVSEDGGTTWTVLNDSAGTAIAITAAGGAAFEAGGALIRPSPSGGSGSQDIDIRLTVPSEYMLA